MPGLLSQGTLANQKPNFSAYKSVPILPAAKAKKDEEERKRRLALLAQSLKGTAINPTIQPKPVQPVQQPNYAPSLYQQAKPFVPQQTGMLGKPSTAITTTQQSPIIPALGLAGEALDRTSGAATSLMANAPLEKKHGILMPQRFSEMVNKSAKDVLGSKAGAVVGPVLGLAGDPLNFAGGFGKVGTTLKSLEALKNEVKTATVSKQFILDLANRADLKQPERNLLHMVLASEGDVVNVKDFTKKVQSQLLPLRAEDTKMGYQGGAENVARYETISLPSESRGPIADYKERIYTSPVKTSAGDVHFSGQKFASQRDLARGYVGQRDLNNYFAHTRIEDLPTSEAQINPDKGGRFNNYGNWDNQYSKEPTRRVIEIQSDLFQKGRLEQETIIPAQKNFDDNIPAMHARKAELAKLEPYRNTWHERIIREEVQQAAKDGKTKLQFPTGETAMKIEGLGEGHVFSLVRGNDLHAGSVWPDNLKTGMNIYDGRSEWIITDVLGDGKFKAVPKNAVDDLGGFDEWVRANKEGGIGDPQNLAETFDISGKVDTSNPIYRFYEKEVGRYLTNKYGAKVVTDPQGVKWYEIAVNKAAAKAPVEAFGAAAGVQQDENGNPTFDPKMAALGIGGAFLGMKGIGVLNEAKLAKALAEARTATHASQIMQVAGLPRDFISKYADAFARISDPSEISKVLKGASGETAQGRGLLRQGERTPPSPPRGSQLPPTLPPTPPSSSLTGGIPPERKPVKGLLESLRQAKVQARPELEAQYAKALSEKAGRVAGVQSTKRGTDALYGALSQMKGELSPKKPSFTPPDITDTEAQQIHNLLLDSKLQPFQKTTAQLALESIRQGVIPTHGEIRLLEDALGYQGELQKVFNALQTSSIPQQAATLQTIAQLLNPKTLIRNLGGNLGFAGLENISQTVATPIDKLLSLFTGKRTTGLPSLITQGKSAKKGLLQGIREARQGIATGPQTQFDLPQIQVFKDKLFGSLEKAMSISLRAPDKAAYTAAFDDSVRSQMAASGVTKATPEMLEQAHYDGLYRTFQDSNTATSFFEGTKKLLNLVGIKDAEGNAFGLGDIVLKYPKTPANLLMRGAAYSPAGFIKTVFEMAKPLVGKQFDQRAFVSSFSRALVGTTGLVGLGATLRQLGILSGSPASDTDVKAVQRTTGQGGYQINVSALKRFILSGLNPDAAKKRDGDTLVSYDWLQPMAAPLSFGAKLADGDVQGAPGAIAESIAGGVDTLQEQPLVSGLKRLLGYGDIKGGAVASLESLPSSFVPTLASQINKTADNSVRSTYDPSKFQEGLNLAKAKIPGLAQTLPKSPDVFGQDREAYQNGSNSIFNVFLNPAFVSQIKENPEAKMVLDIYERTGEQKQMPRVVAKNQTVNGQQIALTAGQYVDLQKYVGQLTKEQFGYLAQDPEFQNLSDEDKVKRLTSVLTDIGKLGKIEVLHDGGDAQKIKLALSIKNDPSAHDEAKKLYDRVLAIDTNHNGIRSKVEKAQKTSYLASLSPQDKAKFDAYESWFNGWKSSNTATVRSLLSENPKKAVQFVHTLPTDEAQRIVLNILTDAEYAIYQSGK